MKARSGFTLVEILIVVIILGILAAIVIPQFSDASTQAKESSLRADLRTVRAQIEMYNIQHNYTLPTAGGLSFSVAMTQYTNVAGSTASTTPVSGYVGPYLRTIPPNPYDNDPNVTEGTAIPAPGNGTGWYFNTSTGAFSANDSAAHAAW